MADICVPPFALSILEMLESAGFEAWLVGGYVRDAIMGRAASDVDIATNAHWEDVKKLCEASGARTHETGVKHGTITVIAGAGKAATDASAGAGTADPSAAASISASVGAGDTGAEDPCAAANAADPGADTSAATGACVTGTSAGDTGSASREASDEQADDSSCEAPPPPCICEVTTYRSDGTYTDSRHPDQVAFISSIEEDLARRDFTINAIAYHPKRGFLDPYGGIDDIECKIIRAVGDAPSRFGEDALRILRACRFSSQLGFSIDPVSYQAMLSNKHRLSRISAERIVHELDAMLMGDHVHDAIMQNADVLAFVIPELVAMKDCAQVTRYHCYDVLEHTAYAVQHCPKDRTLRWAALCHDMGKPASAFFDENGTEHFYGHAQIGAKIARGLLDRLPMGSAFKNEVVSLVENHNDTVVPTARSVRRALVRMGGDVELFRRSMELKRADMLAHAPRYAAESKTVDDVLGIVDELLENNEAFCLKDLAINGDDLIKQGMRPGKAIRSLLNSALEAVADGTIANEKRALLDFCEEKAAGGRYDAD